MGRKILRVVLWIVGIVIALIILLVGYLTVWAVRNVKVDTNAAATNSAPDSFSQTIDLTLLHAALKNYHDHNNGTYPTSLGELVPKYLPSIPSDTGGQPYTYKVTQNGRGYHLCNQKLDGATQCLGKDSAGTSTGV